jgi:hypothetical protein
MYETMENLIHSFYFQQKITEGNAGISHSSGVYFNKLDKYHDFVFLQ